MQRAGRPCRRGRHVPRIVRLLYRRANTARTSARVFPWGAIPKTVNTWETLERCRAWILIWTNSMAGGARHQNFQMALMPTLLRLRQAVYQTILTILDASITARPRLERFSRSRK